MEEVFLQSTFLAVVLDVRDDELLNGHPARLGVWPQIGVEPMRRESFSRNRTAVVLYSAIRADSYLIRFPLSDAGISGLP